MAVLDKENAQARTGVLVMDASKGFMKDRPRNGLGSQDIHEIIDAFNEQAEVERYSRMVPVTEIADPKNDYNLNIPSAEPRISVKPGWWSAMIVSCSSVARSCGRSAWSAPALGARCAGSLEGEA